VLGRVVQVLVHADDDGDVLVLGRRRDDHLLRPGLHVYLGLLGVGEDTGRLDHHVRAQVTPGQLARVTLGERLERLSAHGDLVRGRLHLVRQPAQDAVVLEQVGEGRVVGEVVHTDQLDVGPPVKSRPEEVTPDPAEAVDTNADGHRTHLLARSDG
jgi:hypothetical protein